MKRFTLASLILMLFAVSAAFSQIDEEQRRQEEDERIRNAASMAQQAMAPSPDSFVGLFMPETETGWTISIIKQGGITGRAPYLVAALNSDGFYTCDAAEQKNITLEGVSFVDDISEIFLSSPLKTLKKNFAQPAGFCNDCISTSMQISHKNKKKVSTSTFTWSVFPESNDDLRSIYNSVIGATNCTK